MKASTRIASKNRDMSSIVRYFYNPPWHHASAVKWMAPLGWSGFKAAMAILFLMLLGVRSANALIFKAISNFPATISSFSFEWDDKDSPFQSGFHVVDNTEVSLPLSSPRFSGVDFLNVGIHYSKLSAVADGITDSSGAIFKTRGFGPTFGPNGNGWYFSGGTFSNGTAAGGGFASIGNFNYEIVTPHFVGPFPDFRGIGIQDVSFTIPTLARKTYHIPFDGNIKITWFDSATVRFRIPYPIFAASYFVFNTIGDPVIEPDAVLTDIYAADLGGALGGPDGDIPLLTGFDPLDPQMVPLSEEQFVGASGTIYPANLVAVTIGDLAAFLPGYDLSRFGGDPNSIVYVAQATVPFSDVAVSDSTAVSEPESFILLLSGIAGLNFLRWKDRKVLAPVLAQGKRIFPPYENPMMGGRLRALA